MTLFIEQCLNGIQFGLLLFLLAAGLTLVFGIMDLVNLAHGSLYMLGAYFAATFVAWTGSFVFGAVLAIAATLLVALLLDAPIGAARVPPPLVALDASASWTRGGDSLSWRAALDSVRGTDDALLLVGDSLRTGPAPDAPAATASRTRPAVERVMAGVVKHMGEA